MIPGLQQPAIDLLEGYCAQGDVVPVTSTHVHLTRVTLNIRIPTFFIQWNPFLPGCVCGGPAILPEYIQVPSSK